MRFRTGRFAFYAGKVASGSNGVNPMWHGHCYGSYLPKANYGQQGSAKCLDVSWLIFHASIYWQATQP